MADSLTFLLNSGNPKLIELNNETSQNVALILQSDGRIANLDTHGSDKSIDVVFPILLGPFSEDGTM